MVFALVLADAVSWRSIRNAARLGRACKLTPAGPGAASANSFLTGNSAVGSWWTGCRGT